MAMGIRNLAYHEVFVMIGARPPQVVNVVKKMGLNHCIPVALTASTTGMPPRTSGSVK